MAGHISLTWTDRRCPAEDEVYPLQIKALRADEETSVYRQDRKLLTGSSCEEENEERRTSVSGGRRMGEESSDDELGQLDIDLNRKSKQHNLTSRNVRAILHEVITHEHVVAMMKAAIRDTQDLPMFEPKMTRSRLKQAVQQGQPLNWSLSTNTIKPPQFVDIDLEENEDSSDEEYCPDEEEEEEDMVEETFLSDADSLASPPRMHQGSPLRVPSEKRMDKSLQKSPGLPREQVMTSTCASQHILTGPEPSFLDKLNAVEEELDCSPAYTYNQAEGGVDEDCLAYRTRSRLPLVNVPLGQLEAKLLAPDITADMYDLSVGQREEDRHWTEWLQGLMTPDSEGEAEDDDDDPEYNVLDDLDEPDLEDYRTDRAVQITKKEVNELLEELFDTLQEEEVAEEEEIPPKAGTKFNIPQALRFEPPLAGLLTERRQTVRKQYEALQQRRALQDTTNHHHSNLKNTPSPPPNTITPILVLPGQVCPTLHVDYTQKLQLQQQIQQHVQLLTQVQLLSRHINALNHEACITKQYLEELQQFSHRRETVFLPSSFRVCNLQGALDLLQEVEQKEKPSPAPATSRRLLPRMTPATNSHAFPLLPTDTAWLFATRPVFLYPELLPVCSLDPALHSRHQRSVYTAGEDGLIVLGLKHFEGTVQSDELISSYLLCKNRWNFRKHIREMSSQRAPPNNVIKMFLKHGVVPPLPLACSRVQPTDQRPPVDRNNSNMPNWLKNSRQIIQKTRLDSNSYPPSLPPGCTLRLHPYWLYKSRPPVPHHRRLFMLAHNASLLPLAKAPGERYTDRQAQPISCLSLPPLGGRLLLQPPSVSGGLPLAPPHVCGTFPLAAAHPVPTHCLPIGQTITRQQTPPHPLLLSSSTNPIMSLTPAAVKPACFLLQMVWTPPTAKSQHALEQGQNRPIREEQEEGSQSSSNLKLIEEDRQDEEEEESLASASTLSQLSSIGEKDEVWKKEENQVEEKEEVERKKWTVVGLVSLNGGENTGGEGGGRGEGGGAGGGGGEQDESRGGDGEQGGEGEEEEARERGQGGGEREENGEKDEDQDRQGEEEEEEDFDDLTQDEDEEEVMSSASEESVLSVPELQETMKQLTWLAAERRLCADGDSEEDHSPTSEEEEEEGGPKEEGPGKGRTSKGGEDEEMPSGEGTARGGGGRCPGRGRGRSRPLRGLRRSRQERHSKDAAKLLLLYDEKLLENDPHRESKDMAFAKSYLSRVCEALQDAPGQVEEFVSLLNEFEQVGEGQEEVVPLFRKLRCILGDRTDLLRDFAAFLHPEQALQCGLFEEQQAFERSRRFLRQLEISFGDNPSHYQKIIKALQTSPDLSPNGIAELKAQMATLLKGHAHLQAEFWVFFDELRPPLARPGQFEEAHWPEEGGGGSDGGEGGNQLSAGGASSGFEEVTLPELDEEDEGHKIQPMTNRRRRRKIDPHRKYKGCDWSDKDWPCSCHDVKIRRHRRKGCSRCHDNKTPGAVSRAMKNLDPLYSQISSSHTDKDLDLKGDDDSPQPDRSSASWEGPFPLTEEEEELGEEEDDEDEEERKNSEKEHSLAVKRSRREEPLLPPTVTPSSSSVTDSSVRSSIFTSVSSSLFTSSSGPPRPSPPPDLPVCAKNISLTASGKKVILWTREADRVILTTCQQDGANQNTFQAISTLLGNKTPSEVSRRFRDLMRLFRTAARQTSSEDEAPSTETAGATNQED